MTGKVINLRRTRKQKGRGQARAQAEANAARHGDTKPARTLRAAQAELDARRLEGHRLAPEDETGDDQR